MKKTPIEEITPIEEAISKLFDNWTFEPETEVVPVGKALGRTLAEDIFALYNQPVVRASRMDGIAVKSADFTDGIPDTSKWVEGVDFVRADTGDDFSDDFDAVIAIEDVTYLPEGGIRLDESVNVGPGSCVAPCGNNIKKGTPVGFAGHVLAPSSLAAAVVGGYGELKVYKKPVISFIPTGSELVAPGSKLERGQNFDSNSIMVETMLDKMGADVIAYPILKDDIDLIEQNLNDALSKSDVVILNGGTSKGGEDFCIQYLEKRGKLLFHGVRSVPGKPLSITMIDDKPVINLSGPSIGALNGCYWLLSVVISRMLKQKESMFFPSAEVTLTEGFSPMPFFSAFKGFTISKTENGTLTAAPVQTMGPNSKGMSAALLADGFWLVPPRKEPYEAGDKIALWLAR